MDEQSAPRKNWKPGLQDLLLFALFLSLVFVQIESFADDPGLGWHIRSGEWMWLNGGVPGFDPFLAAVSRAWVSDQWLSDLLIYALYSLGWPALYGGFILAFLWTFAFLQYRNCTFCGANAVAATLSVLLTFKVAEIHFVLRPVILSFFFFTVNFRLCLEALTSGARLQTAGWWILLYLFWANMHPSFILGLATLGACTFVAFLERQKGARALLLLFTIAALITLCNPYGWALHRSIFALGNSEFFMRLNEEWRAPDPGRLESVLVLLFALSNLAALVVLESAKNARSRFAGLITLVFAILSFRSIRFFPYVAVTSVVNCALLFSGFSFRGLAGQMIRGLDTYERASSRGSLAIGFCVVVLALSSIWPGLLYERFGPGRAFPHDSLQALKRLYPAREVNVLASPDWGGFITLAGAANIRPLTDDRNALSGETFYREIFAANESDEAFDKLLERYSVSHVLVQKGSGWFEERSSNSDKVNRVHEDDSFILYEVVSTTRRSHDGTK